MARNAPVDIPVQILMIRFFKRSMRRLPSNPSSVSALENYSDNFDQAVAFTRDCGFATGVETSAREDAHEINAVQIENALSAAGIKDTSASAHQCLKWSYHFAPFLERELQRPVHLTIGQFWVGGQPMFNPSWKNLEDWSRSGLTFKHVRDEGRKGVNLHAWLTVGASMIVDISVLSTVAAMLDSMSAECRGRLIWGPAAKLHDSYQYFPMAVGQSFAEALDKGRELKLLAHDLADLYTYPRAIVAN